MQAPSKPRHTHDCRSLRLKLGLGQPDGALTLFPLTALLEELDPLKTFEHGTLATDGARSFQGGVFGHDCVKVRC